MVIFGCGPWLFGASLDHHKTLTLQDINEAWEQLKVKQPFKTRRYTEAPKKKPKNTQRNRSDLSPSTSLEKKNLLKNITIT